MQSAKAVSVSLLAVLLIAAFGGGHQAARDTGTSTNSLHGKQLLAAAGEGSTDLRGFFAERPARPTSK
jgi:hypothetical protein